jgi:type IV secretory pathway TrbF-like protein
MKKILSLLGSRTRLVRPEPVISVPAALAKQYRVSARRSFLFGVAGFGYGLWERSNHVAALSRPPQNFGAILGSDFSIIRTVAADGLTESEFQMAARATAAQFVRRMRNLTDPVDFTLADIEEGNYFIKDMAVVKVREWLEARPFDRMAQRRQKRIVLLSQIIPTLRPGQAMNGDKLLIAVTWSERIDAPGSSSRTEAHGGEVMTERVRNLSPEISMHNPLGIFVSDFSFDTTI